MKKVLMAVVVTAVRGASNLPKTESFIGSASEAVDVNHKRMSSKFFASEVKRMSTKFMNKVSSKHERSKTGVPKPDSLIEETSLPRRFSVQYVNPMHTSLPQSGTEGVAQSRRRGQAVCKTLTKTQSAGDATSGTSWSFKMPHRGVQSVRLPNAHQSEEEKRFSFRSRTKKKYQISGDSYNQGVGVENVSVHTAKSSQTSSDGRKKKPYTASDANESRMFSTGTARRSSADLPSLSTLSISDLDPSLSMQRLEESLRG